MTHTQLQQVRSELCTISKVAYDIEYLDLSLVDKSIDTRLAAVKKHIDIIHSELFNNVINAEKNIIKESNIN